MGKFTAKWGKGITALTSKKSSENQVDASTNHLKQFLKLTQSQKEAKSAVLQEVSIKWVSR